MAKDISGVGILLAPIFNTTSHVVGTDPTKVTPIDVASVGKLLNVGFPTESLAGVMKKDKEALVAITKKAIVPPTDDTQPGGPAAPADPTGGTTKPAPKVTWAKRTDMAMQAKGKNTARPIDAVLPFMGGKFGLNLFQSTGVNPDDVPTIIEALKQNGFTMMSPPTDDGDGDGVDCYSFMHKDGTHVYMEIDMDNPDGGSIAWVIETPDKEINVDGPAPTGDTRQVQSRFGQQQKRAKIAQQAAQTGGTATDMGAQPTQPTQKNEKWTRLKPAF